ncbi:hypothetical protein [Saccharicrinis aurantiacus]|uniref:hypothetical protein n=1 Tax=Saccharicrinis aurantiacus TaxID=1849719 RepID=UPI00083934F2|nr:hypothetical protein [Saccharicrinis aurantiacus]
MIDFITENIIIIFIILILTVSLIEFIHKSIDKKSQFISKADNKKKNLKVKFRNIFHSASENIDHFVLLRNIKLRLVIYSVTAILITYLGLKDILNYELILISLFTIELIQYTIKRSKGKVNWEAIISICVILLIGSLLLISIRTINSWENSSSKIVVADSNEVVGKLEDTDKPPEPNAIAIFTLIITSYAIFVATSVFLPRFTLKQTVKDEVNKMKDQLDYDKNDIDIEILKTEAHDNRMNAYFLLKHDEFIWALGWATKSYKQYLKLICKEDFTADYTDLIQGELGEIFDKIQDELLSYFYKIISKKNLKQLSGITVKQKISILNQIAKANDISKVDLEIKSDLANDLGKIIKKNNIKSDKLDEGKIRRALKDFYDVRCLNNESLSSPKMHLSRKEIEEVNIKIQKLIKVVLSCVPYAITLNDIRKITSSRNEDIDTYFMEQLGIKDVNTN